MNARTKILLGAMVLMVGAWVGDQFGLLSFLEAASEGPSELDKVRLQIDKAEDIILQGARAADVLQDFEKRSLPFDSVAARSEYQSWWTGLVEENNIKKSTVEVGDPTPVSIKDGDGKSQEVYKRYGFTVSGTGQLDNITELLYSFYRAGHLHKITSLTLTPGAAGIFNLSVVGEALGVATCDRKSELSTEVNRNSARDSVEAYASIVRRNIFSREGGMILKQIKLSSITFDKTGQPEAWFQIDQTQNSKRLQRNEELRVSVHTVKVIDIQPRSALVELDGRILEVSIGQSMEDSLNAEPVQVAEVNADTDS